MVEENGLNNNDQKIQNGEHSKVTASARDYLSMNPLTFQELPPHPDFPHGQAQVSTLKSFLEGVFGEAYQFDLENGWASHGTFQPKSSQGTVKMPITSGPVQVELRDMPMTVDQRAKGSGKSAWLARRSFHDAVDVEYSELDDLLAQDHARQEKDYTPSVFDANELVKWDARDLDSVVKELNSQWRVQKVQMSIYQMFHMMPSAAGGLVKLQNRVFHVLVATAHSLYTGDPAQGLQQALTLQLPVNIRTFSHVPTVMERSHMSYESKRYKYKGSSDTTKWKHDGNSLTEGCYVSLERLRMMPADGNTGKPTPSASTQWDMMTMSDAKGITSIASKKQIMDGTFDAVTKDVYYVLNHIRQRRLDGLDKQKQDEIRKQIGEMKEEMDFTKVKL